MSRDIKRDIMCLVTCLPPEDILVLTLYIGSFQDAIDRKDTLLRGLVEASKHMLDRREHVRVSGDRPDVDMFLAANRVLGAVIDKAEQEIGDE